MNNVNLIGRITDNPELKISENENGEVKRVRFTLAVNRKFSDTTDFINCVAFNKSAEFINNYVKKGQRIAVEGHLQTSSYDFQIAKNKSKRIYSVDVVTDSVSFADSKKESVE